MDTGHFYFLKEEYFNKFDDIKLMQNKEQISGNMHKRPCFFAFQDKHTGLYWMIPFFSKVDKYKRIYRNKIKKYGICDTIVFGQVLGHEKAFLIQNMCPTNVEFIENEYFDKRTGNAVMINGELQKELISKAKKVLQLQRKGIDIVFPDILRIEESLVNKIMELN